VDASEVGNELAVARRTLRQHLEETFGGLGPHRRAPRQLNRRSVASLRFRQLHNGENALARDRRGTLVRRALCAILVRNVLGRAFH
jgi:hypothetical protein